MLRTGNRLFRPRLCRLEDRTVPAAGMLDPTFGVGGKLHIQLPREQSNGATAIDSQGRVLIAGGDYEGTLGGANGFTVVRLTPTGALDSTFGGSGVVTNYGLASAGAVAVDSLGRILVAGGANSAAGGANTDSAVVRLTADGAVDSSFDGDGLQTIDFGSASEVATGIAVDSQDRVVVNAYQNTFPPRLAVGRLTTTGALDTSFDGDGKQTLDLGSYSPGVAVDSLDRVVITGVQFHIVSPTSRVVVVRLTTAGALDTSFNGTGSQVFSFSEGVNSEVKGVAVDSLFRVVVAGIVPTALGQVTRFGVARLTTTGALDTSFDGDGRKEFSIIPGNWSTAHAVAVDSLDRVVVAGRTNVTSNTNEAAVARLTTTGAFDTSFSGDGKQSFSFHSANGYNDTHAVAIDSLDRVVVAGEVDLMAPLQDDLGVARLTGDTTTASVQINDGSAQRSRVTSLTIRFSGDVKFNGPPAQAFTLVRNGGKPVNFDSNVSVQYGGTIVTLTNFTGLETQFLSLRDARFTFTALASEISADGQPFDGDANGTPGGNLVFGDAQGLFRMFGDFNGDSQVDGADFGAFSSTYGLLSSHPNFLWYFDVNGDGQIDGFDFGHFSGRFNTILP